MRTRSGARRGVPAAVAVLALGLSLLAGATAAAAAPLAAGDGELDWGVRASFRSYIVGPIAKGSIETSGGATQNAANGTFVFTAGSGTVDPQAATADLAYSGTVRFLGHDDGSGPQLEVIVRDPAVSVAGGVATLSADVTSRALTGGGLVDYGVIPFATFPLAPGTSLVPGPSGAVTLATGQGTLTSQGIPAFANFYEPPNDFVDALQLTAIVGGGSQPAVPTVTVSRTVVDPAGDTVTVTGAGFDPSLAIGTRPPLAGRPAGVFIAFGSFLDVWRPSEGAPPASRATGPQGTSVTWAVLEGDRATVGQGASVTLSPDGSFTAEIQVQEGFPGALENGNYGIYTYAGSGAAVPSYETFTPLTFESPNQGASVSQTIVASISETGGLTMSVDATTVTLPVAELSTDGRSLAAAATLNAVRITDLRAADPGWTVSGRIGDFTSATGSTFAGSRLGWTPAVLSTAPTQTVQPGPAVAPSASGGLTASSLLGSAPAGAGRGTSELGGAVSLEVPSETAPGTYSAVLTLTAL